MPIDLVARPRQTQAQAKTRSWLEAYRLFLMNPKEGLPTKLLPLAALGLVPISLVDDLLLPFVGLLDNIPTSLFVMFVIFRTWQRVRTYR